MPALSALAAALRRPPSHRFVAVALLAIVCVAGASLVARGQSLQPPAATQSLSASVQPPTVELVSKADLTSYVGWILVGFAGVGFGIAFAAGAFRSRIESDVRATKVMVTGDRYAR